MVHTPSRFFFFLLNFQFWIWSCHVLCSEVVFKMVFFFFGVCQMLLIYPLISWTLCMWLSWTVFFPPLTFLGKGGRGESLFFTLWAWTYMIKWFILHFLEMFYWRHQPSITLASFHNACPRSLIHTHIYAPKIYVIKMVCVWVRVVKYKSFKNRCLR